MKKLDKLILSSFLGPFILTFLVVVFILLTQHMLKYFDDIIGKGLGFDVIGQLLFYFAVFMTPVAMPLGVLLSSLITYGNLGEHFELTAIKGAGISLLRTVRPIFFFVIILTITAFYINNNLVPKAALEAYSLLYDIKQKKPALDLREGTFYNGIPDISIKVNEKMEDGITLKDIIIYDHRKHDGNKDITVADSGKMYTILNERYLTLELFNGYNYTEGSSTNQDLVGKQVKYNTETLSRSKFAKSQVVFDLSSFQLSRTDKKWFQGNRIMRNMNELDADLDSLDKEVLNYSLIHYNNYRSFFAYFTRTDSLALPAEVASYKKRKDSLALIAFTNTEPDSLQEYTKGRSYDPDTTSVKATGSSSSGADHEVGKKITAAPPPEKGRRRRDVFHSGIDSLAMTIQPVILSDSAIHAKLDSVYAIHLDVASLANATNKARVVKSQLAGTTGSLDVYNTDRRVFQIQWHKILASSLACVVMFLIGAPLGAIIKKGGLGVPFLVSILFFIIYYLLTMVGEKWAKQGIVPVELGVWAADFILFVVGLFFLRQARIDARLFEADFYQVVFDKVRTWMISKGYWAEPEPH